MSSEEIATLTVGPRDVIIIRDPEFATDEGTLASVAQTLHDRFPDNLVFWMHGDMTIETMTEEHLRSVLEGLLEHQEARAKRS